MVHEAIVGSDPVDLLSLPIDGDREWYTGGLGESKSVDAVRSGAPLRTSPADAPDGFLRGVTPTDEELRVSAFREQTLERIEAMLANHDMWPRDVQVHFEETPAGHPRQIVDVSAASALLAQAMDTGHGRYLGLATRLDAMTRIPRTSPIGLFAANSGWMLPDRGPLADLLNPPPDLLDDAAIYFADRMRAVDLINRLHERHGDALAVYALIARGGRTAGARPTGHAQASPRRRPLARRPRHHLAGVPARDPCR